MEITSNAPLRDPHEPVVPEGQLPAAHTEDHPAQAPDASNLVELLSDGLKQANEAIEAAYKLNIKANMEVEKQVGELNAAAARIAELERENAELKAAATVASTPLDEQLAEQPAPPAIEPAP